MAVQSPCIDVCRFDGRTGYCHGCLRTLDEARTWRKLTDHKRHSILAERSRRQAKFKQDDILGNHQGE